MCTLTTLCLSTNSHSHYSDEPNKKIMLTFFIYTTTCYTYSKYKNRPNDFYLKVFMFWFDTEKALFQVILGLLCLSSSITMYKSVYVHVVHDLRYVLCCAIE